MRGFSSRILNKLNNCVFLGRVQKNFFRHTIHEQLVTYEFSALLRLYRANPQSSYIC